MARFAQAAGYRRRGRLVMMEDRLEIPAEEDLEERPQRRREWSGALRSIVLPLAILGVIVGGLWYWQSRADDGAVVDGGFGAVDLPAGRNPTDEGPKAEVGRAGPDFLLESPGAPALRLSDLQGQPVVLNFWATWCGPCREEIPELVAAYEKHRGEGLVIIGINLQEADGRVLDFADEFGMEFPIVIDRDGEVADKWRLGGPVQGIPTSYFLDETGVIQDFYFGPMTDDALEERIGLLLPENGG